MIGNTKATEEPADRKAIKGKCGDFPTSRMIYRKILPDLDIDKTGFFGIALNVTNH